MLKAGQITAITARQICRGMIALAMVLVFQSSAAHANQNPAENDWIYSVRPDDTIWSISKTYLDSRYSWHQLLHYNRIQEPADLGVGTILRIPVSWLRQQPAPALADQVQGNVQIRRARQSRFTPLKKGQSLGIGDEIRSHQGTVQIRFADGSTLDLNQGSTLIFNSLTRYGDSGMVDTRTRLMNGSLATEVKPQQQGARYEIATPSAVAAVRGTSFRLTADANSTRAEVTEGVVHLQTEQGSLPLQAGFGASVGPSVTDPRPVSLLPAPQAVQVPKLIDQLPWALSWQPVPGAAAYVAELYQGNADGARLRSIRVNQTEWSINQLNNGHYWLVLRAIDPRGFEGLDFKSPLEIKISSKPASPISPSDLEDFHEGQPQFRWQLQQAGDLSRLEIAHDRDFKDPVSQTAFAHHTQALPDRRLQPGRYFWRVTTLAGGDSLSYSPVREVHIHGEMPPTRIMAVNYFKDRVKLFWNSLEQTSEFVVQIANDPQFNDVVREERVNTPYVSIQLPEKRRYYARVKGVADEFYSSEFSEGREIELP